MKIKISNLSIILYLLVIIILLLGSCIERSVKNGKSSIRKISKELGIKEDESLSAYLKQSNSRNFIDTFLVQNFKITDTNKYLIGDTLIEKENIVSIQQNPKYPLIALIITSDDNSDKLIIIFKIGEFDVPLWKVRGDRYGDYSNIWSAKGTYVCFDNLEPWFIEIFLTEDIKEGILSPILELSSSKLREESDKKLLHVKEEQGLKFENEEDSLNFFYIGPAKQYYFNHWINDSVFSYSTGCCGEQSDYLYWLKHDTSIFIRSYEAH